MESKFFRIKLAMLLCLTIACNRVGKVNDDDSDTLVDTLNDTVTADSTAAGSDTVASVDTSSNPGPDTVTNADTIGDTSAGSVDPPVDTLDTVTEIYDTVPVDTAESDSDLDLTVPPCPSPTQTLTKLIYTSPIGMDAEMLYFWDGDPFEGDIRTVNKGTGAVSTWRVPLPTYSLYRATVADGLYIYFHNTPIMSVDPVPNIVVTAFKESGNMVDDPLQFDYPISKLRVNQGELFILPHDQKGLLSIDPATGEVTEWLQPDVDVEDFWVTDDWVYWISKTSKSFVSLARRPRGGGELSEELASGENLSVLAHSDNRILLWADGTVAGPVHYSALLETTGLIWLEPGSQSGLDFPQVLYTGMLRLDRDDPYAITERFVYVATHLGRLWRMPLDGVADGRPALIEVKGGYDDDDYSGQIHVDDTAIFWLAGLDPGYRAADDDPVGVFRTCLSVAETAEPFLDPIIASVAGYEMVMTVEEFADHPDWRATNGFIADEDYSSVANGDDYTVRFSDNLEEVRITGGSLTDGELIGIEFPDEDSTAVFFNIIQGLDSSGVFTLSVNGGVPSGELILFVPSEEMIIQGERGDLIRVE